MKPKINKALHPFMVPIGKIKPDPKNARLHSERNILAIMQSLEKFGQQKSIVIHKGFTLAGAGTLEAAKRLGWDKIAAIPFDQKEAEAMGYKHSDNRTAELATWDIPQLALDLKAMEKMGFDLELMGWDASELKSVFDDDGPRVSDGSMLERLKVTIDDPETKLVHGQVVEMGKHRLVIADPVREVGLWFKLLKEDFIFAPYPGPYIALTISAEKKTVLMVQPDVYIAGHIVDHWKEFNAKNGRKV